MHCPHNRHRMLQATQTSRTPESHGFLARNVIALIFHAPLPPSSPPSPSPPPLRNNAGTHPCIVPAVAASKGAAGQKGVLFHSAVLSRRARQDRTPTEQQSLRRSAPERRRHLLRLETPTLLPAHAHHTPHTFTQALAESTAQQKRIAAKAKADWESRMSKENLQPTYRVSCRTAISAHTRTDVCTHEDEHTHTDTQTAHDTRCTIHCT